MTDDGLDQTVAMASIPCTQMPYNFVLMLPDTFPLVKKVVSQKTFSIKGLWFFDILFISRVAGKDLSLGTCYTVL